MWSRQDLSITSGASGLAPVCCWVTALALPPSLVSTASFLLWLLSKSHKRVSQDDHRPAQLCHRTQQLSKGEPSLLTIEFTLVSPGTFAAGVLSSSLKRWCRSLLWARINDDFWRVPGCDVMVFGVCNMDDSVCLVADYEVSPGHSFPWAHTLGLWTQGNEEGRKGSVFISLRISKYPGNMNVGEACF